MFLFILDGAHGKYKDVQYLINTDIVVHQLKNTSNQNPKICMYNVG